MHCSLLLLLLLYRVDLLRHLHWCRWPDGGANTEKTIPPFSKITGT